MKRGKNKHRWDKKGKEKQYKRCKLNHINKHIKCKWFKHLKTYSGSPNYAYAI